MIHPWVGFAMQCAADSREIRSQVFLNLVNGYDKVNAVKGGPH